MSATAVKSARTEAVEFTPPPIRKGDMVHWYPGGDAAQVPHIAIVAEAYRRNAVLLVMDPTLHNFIIKDSVLHMEDPDLKKDWAADFGGWTYTPQHLEYLELAARLASLEKALGGAPKK